MPPVFPRSPIAAPTPAGIIRRGLAFVKRVPAGVVAARDALTRRQDSSVGIIPPSYQVSANPSLSPGAIAGIVLGAVLGTLFIVWIIWWAAYQQNGAVVEEEVIVRPRSRSPRRKRRSSHRDMSEYRGSRSYSPRRRSTQIVEERVVEERIPVRSRAPSMGAPPPPVETIIVDDRRPRRYSRDDEVIVIEDGSSYASDVRRDRRKSRRNSGRQVFSTRDECHTY
jgi:hypothetical protein